MAKQILIENGFYYEKSGHIKRKITNDQFEFLKSLTEFIIEPSRKSLRERVFCIEREIAEIPICLECEKNVNFLSSGKYAEFCSTACSRNSEKTKDKKVKTSMKNYGTRNPRQSKEVNDKILSTNLERYGYANPMSSQKCKDKSKATCLEKYGKEHSFQSENNKLKSLATCLEKYGVGHTLQAKEITDKIKATNIEKYGVENPFRSPLIRDKIKATNIEKYGVENPGQSEEVKDKMKETCLERYGVEYALQSEEFKDKSKATCLEKYGVENPSQSQDVKDKMSITMTKNFSKRRSDEGTDYSGVVYILHFPKHKAVKIGLTGDFDQRAKGLIKDFGPFSIIELIETEQCYSLEAELHKKYSAQRICLSEGHGRTEFFKEEILNKGHK
jgi:hypothetical protein